MKAGSFDIDTCVEEVRGLGYEVNELAEGSGTYRVTGFGVDTVYEADDQVAWQRLAYHELHRYRQDVFRATDATDSAYRLTDDDMQERMDSIVSSLEGTA